MLPCCWVSTPVQIQWQHREWCDVLVGQIALLKGLKRGRQRLKCAASN